ncbi:Sec23/Sec24 trunk domain-containing protein [Cardiosporidium cionae]|uniref:Protein transport protein SEC23 n=1 Tax=Cardiosporidium cionae TaxID=476202 RepID=A0ABQ7JAH1_9APIC|nr:Sec23/Sec24 trunk domain-containing protein [Cardiosporidium cionae]|eukprot:KAF8820950.1 Sec23/Sec24 trunk domain-containing protein [Cardiosporidium cionae]
MDQAQDQGLDQDLNRAQIELQAGLRFSWTIWPASRQEASRIEIPLGCLYTPLRDNPSIPLVEYEPLRSRTGGPVLNPYCAVDYQSNKSWVCPFTLARSLFPPRYADHISERTLPTELMYPSIEYILPDRSGSRAAGFPADSHGSGGHMQQGEGSNLPGAPQRAVGAPAFVLVVDTCLHEKELEVLKDILQQALSLMPRESLIGLVTFGTMAYVHELGFVDCPKSYVFSGRKDLTEQQVQQQLGIAARNDPRGAASQAAIRRFLLPVVDCELTINSILEDLQRDSWPTPYDQRQKRCTGVALCAAVALVGCCCYQQSARVMLFVGGACTVGPGQVVDVPLAESIRQHLDLQKENHNARFVKKALKFYTALAHRAVSNGHVIDIFCGSLDQVGLYEMRVCCEKTGGYVVMSDSFGIGVFKDTFKKIFDTDSNNYLQHGYSARMEVFCSKDFKVCGAIGTCTSNNKKGSQVSETSIGEGSTCEWLIGAIDRRTSLAFYFEITNQNSSGVPPGKQSFLQFQTYYTHPSGTKRLRVTTASYRFAEPSVVDISPGFDQEAATVLMARLAVFKTETEEPTDVMRWLDRKLIRLVSRFADFQKDDPSSFHLSSEFSAYPQFMYNLRRSHFLQTFNASPDEIAYYRAILLRENVANSLVMIQPALLQYTCENLHSEPVFLDAKSLKYNVVLLLDSFFHVIVWHGERICQWEEARYHEMPEYENFKLLLQIPTEDAQAIVEERFPVPKFIKCNAGGSQARFLLAKVNPSTTYSSLANRTGFDGNDIADTSIINTDDVSLSIFMEHLIKLAVQS